MFTKNAIFLRRTVNALIVGSALTCSGAYAVTLNFDGLIDGAVVPEGYGGLIWDTGASDFFGIPQGAWYSSSSPSFSTAHSGSGYLVNGYGPQDLGITFSSPATSVSAWFALTTNGTGPGTLELIGYVGDTPTYSSALAPSSTPQLLEISGVGITRVVVHGAGAGWYAMDDLTVSAVPESGGSLMFCVGLIGLILACRRKGGPQSQ